MLTRKYIHYTDLYKSTSKDADWIANMEHPDQTAPLGDITSWVKTFSKIDCGQASFINED